jgi:hypothetical protein
MISLVATTNVNVSNPNTVTISNGNVIVGQLGATDQGSNSTDCNNVSPNTQNIIQNLVNIPSDIYNSIVNFFKGGSCSYQGNSLNQNLWYPNGTLIPAGESSIQSSNSNIGGILVSTLIIAGAFIALGLLAGVFGAGSLAYIVAPVGIAVSLIYFMQGVLSTPYFTGTPFVITIFLTGITTSMFIWIVLVIIRD